ncbi:MAG: DNA-binding IclR family transcriptional regulator [Woeseiaceae bacterium]|jgi:DNA-binding IclR family transcriptional regulator
MTQYIQSIERAVRVLKVLSEGDNLMGVTEIAEKLNLGKSTVHRILASLMRSNMVRLNPTSHQYSLGYGLLQLTAGLLRSSEISITALSYLRDLRQETGETVALNVRDHDYRTVVERLDTLHEIRYVTEIGRPIPLDVGAGGKAILAFMDEIEVRRIQKLSKLSRKQVRDLDRELADIRAKGTACTFGERFPGAGAIAAPVFNHVGDVIASVIVLCLESRLDTATIAVFRKLVQKTATNISRELGWQAEGSRQLRERVAAR